MIEKNDKGGKRVAYVRVSTFEQNEERQLEALKNLQVDKIYTEKVSAKDRERPKLKSMLEFIREGDEVIVCDFSRLARSTKDLLEIVEELEEKKVRLISLKENLDTSTPTGRLLLTVIAAINEFERTNLLERQREGIAIAKEKGKYKGRKKVILPEGWEEKFKLYMKREIKGGDFFRWSGLSRSTFYARLKECEAAWKKEE